MTADRASFRSRCPLIFVAALVAVLAIGAAGAVGPAWARSAADCQPFTGRPCLFPFPSDLFTRRDRSSVTGLRVALPARAMPRNTKGARIATGPYDRADGFSPGSDLVLHVAGLDNQRAFRRTDPVQLADMARAFDRRAPIVVIDEATGQRQLIWSELDANATGAGNTDLLIHPGRNFIEGHTYVAALRDLRTGSGRVITAPRWFARLRDGRPLPGAQRSQRGRYARIFAALARAGIARHGLYEAWDFTVASRQDLTSRMLAIRNNAFAQLGDHDLADSSVQGRAPTFALTGTATLPATAGVTGPVTSVTGTFQVPCYLVVCGAAAQPGFHYSSPRPDATPTQIPGNVATAASNASSRHRRRRPIRRASRSMATACSAATTRSRPRMSRRWPPSTTSCSVPPIGGGWRSPTRSTTPAHCSTSTSSRPSSIACSRAC